MYKNNFFQYLESEKRFSNNTILSYSVDINQFLSHLKKEFQIENVSEITFQYIRSWIASLLNSEIKPRSVNRKISTLKTYFRFLLNNRFQPILSSFIIRS